MDHHFNRLRYDGLAEPWSAGATEVGSLELTQYDQTAKTQRAFRVGRSDWQRRSLIAPDGTALIDRDLLVLPPLDNVPVPRLRKIVERTVALPHEQVRAHHVTRVIRPAPPRESVVEVVSISWGASAVGAAFVALFSAFATMLALSVV